MINDYTIFMSYSHFTDFFIYQCTTWFVGCVYCILYSSIQVIRPNWLVVTPISEAVKLFSHATPSRPLYTVCFTL